MTPYYSDGTTTLYLGDMREVLPALGITADLVATDPPYGETSLAWDRWPEGWLQVAADVSKSLWCFGSMRMFLQRGHEYAAAGWRLSQDVVWEKHNGPGFQTDRFRRVHEHATHWYQGAWSEIHHQTPRVHVAAPTRVIRRKAIDPNQYGERGACVDVRDGSVLTRSVIYARSMQRAAIHPTEKPVEILTPLLVYACPPGGLVVDPFAGSGSTLVAARESGRRAVGVEADERYAEAVAVRLAAPRQGVLL